MDVRKIRKEALKQGWRVEETTDGLRFTPPFLDKPSVQWHHTSSDRRSEGNFLAALRASGLVDRAREQRKKKDKRRD